MRKEMHHEARLTLIRMVAEIIDDVFAAVDVWPEDRRKEKLRPLYLKLAEHLLEVIATVSVEHHQLGNSLAHERLAHIADESELRAGIHVDAKRDVELSG